MQLLGCICWWYSYLGNDHYKIIQLKNHLFGHFQTKDLGKLKYFVGVEVAQSRSGIFISQRKYVLDIFKQTGMLDCKSIDSPIDPNSKLLPERGEPISNSERYRRDWLGSWIILLLPDLMSCLLLELWVNLCNPQVLLLGCNDSNVEIH